MSSGIFFDTKDAVPKLRKAGISLSPIAVSKLIGLRWLALIDEGFRKEGLEGRWRKLSPVTLKMRRRGRGIGTKILQDSVTLRQSYTPGDPDSLFSATPTQVTVGTVTKYAAFHEFGTSSIPRRKMLPSRKLALAEAAKTAQVMFDKVLKDHGLS